MFSSDLLMLKEKKVKMLFYPILVCSCSINICLSSKDDSAAFMFKSDSFHFKE